RLELLAQIAQEPANQALEGHALATDLRRLLHQAGAQHRFQRPHEAPFGPIHISVHRGASEMDAAVLKAEEQRRRDGQVLAFSGDQERRLSAGAKADGRIGGAKVDATMKTGHETARMASLQTQKTPVRRRLGRGRPSTPSALKMEPQT